MPSFHQRPGEAAPGVEPGCVSQQSAHMRELRPAPPVRQQNPRQIYTPAEHERH